MAGVEEHGHLGVDGGHDLSSVVTHSGVVQRRHVGPPVALDARLPVAPEPVDLGVPGAAIGRSLCHRSRERLQAEPRVTAQRDLGRVRPSKLIFVDVEMNQSCSGGDVEQGPAAGVNVTEVRSDSDDEIAAPCRLVGMSRAGPSDAADCETMSLGKRALAGRRGCHRDLRALREAEQLVPCARAMDAAAHDEERATRAPEQGGSFDHAGRIWRRGMPLGPWPGIGQGVGDQRVLDVEWHLEDDWARAPGDRRAVGPQEHIDRGIGARDEHGLFRDRLDDLRPLLGRVPICLFDSAPVEPVCRARAGEDEHRDGLIEGAGEGRHDVRIARSDARRHDRHRGLAPDSPVPVRHLHRVVFGSGRDPLDPRVVHQCIEERPVAVTVHAKHVLRAHAFQKLRQR